MRHGEVRDNGHVAELTNQLNVSRWPAGSRVLVRREPAHPNAQLAFTDTNGYRFQALLTRLHQPAVRIHLKAVAMSVSTTHRRPLPRLIDEDMKGVMRARRGRNPNEHGSKPASKIGTSIRDDRTEPAPETESLNPREVS